MKIAISRGRKSEQGQTIAIVALMLVALVGFAALAIDVSALYVARNEAQRAADAAALAGARVFASSSYASVPNSFGAPSQVCATSGPGSTAAVNKLVEATAHENLIANQPATVTNISCNLFTGDPTRDQNPQVTVTVKQNNLPSFFSRMWSNTNSSVTATATAEAYNASGRDVPVVVTGAKPWLVTNCDESNTTTDPNTNCVAPGGHYGTFIKSDGTLTGNGSYIGNVIPLSKVNSVPTSPPPPTADNFYALNFATPAVACPAGGGSCTADGAYRDDIQCSSPVTLTCGQVVPSSDFYGGSGYQVRTREATQCLIHSEGPNLRDDGQDIFHFPGAGKVPVRIEVGDDNPNTSIPAGSQNISNSSSVVTVPLYDGHPLCAGGACTGSATIVGFLQLGITRSCNGVPVTGGSNTQCKTPLSAAGNPHLEAIILNAVGCKPGLPVGGLASTQSSPIAVRLIHQ
jgi:Putative Flp pilus-assembly TadE/G-like